MSNKKGPKISLKLRDDFFTAIFVVTGVVFVWRGLWNLMDMYIFPDRPFLSNLVSIGIGLFLLYLPDEDIKELI